MQSKTEIYHDSANQCEARAEEMPPTLRREFLALADHWRKLASQVDEVKVEDRPKKRSKTRA